MIYVIVTSRVKEGCMPEFLAACCELRPKVLAEEGCVGYVHTLDVASPIQKAQPVDPHSVTLIESWASMEAFEAHGKVPHGRQFAEKVRDLRESVTLRVVETLPS